MTKSRRIRRIAFFTHAPKAYIQESGELMLEGMLVTLVTIFVLVWILALGFLYYERYLTTIVTTDAAVKIASTYSNTDSDIIMGYVSTEELSKRRLYRHFSGDGLEAVNEARAASYVYYILDKTNFAGSIKNVDVELKLVSDSMLRKHVELTTVCEFNTPLGGVFEIFGMKRTRKYEAKACADCTDVADYISTEDFRVAVVTNRFNVIPGVVDKAVGLINTIIETFG